MGKDVLAGKLGLKLSRLTEVTSAARNASALSTDVFWPGDQGLDFVEVFLHVDLLESTERFYFQFHSGRQRLARMAEMEASLHSGRDFEDSETDFSALAGARKRSTRIHGLHGYLNGDDLIPASGYSSAKHAYV